MFLLIYALVNIKTVIF